MDFNKALILSCLLILRKGTGQVKSGLSVSRNSRIKSHLLGFMSFPHRYGDSFNFCITGKNNNEETIGKAIIS